MKRLLGLLLVMGMVGCGEPHPFKQLGAWINRNEQGEIVEVSGFQPETTDAILVHLKGLNNLKSLSLGMTKVTDAGLRHLHGTQVSNGGRRTAPDVAGLRGRSPLTPYYRRAGPDSG